MTTKHDPAPTLTRDRFEGCVLGLALGDAMGAPFEGGPLERFVWKVIGTTRKGEMRFTDDTQMSIDVAESLLEKGNVDPDDLARRFARSYRFSRGYGPSAAKLLKRIRRGADWRSANRSVFRDGSYGNGGAMRAPVIGLFHADRPSEIPNAAAESARVTHAHELAVEGAVLIATATERALRANDPATVLTESTPTATHDAFTARLIIAREWVESSATPEANEVRTRLGNGIAAVESCVTALYIAMRFLREPYLDLLAFVASCRGDVDTIAAMAGAIWGASNGASALPEEPLSRLEQRDRLRGLGASLHEAARPAEANANSEVDA